MEFRNQVLAELTPSQLTLLQPHLIERHLVSGEVLYQPGDRVEAVFFPSTAVTSVVTVMEDGRCVESATLGNESVVGAVPALSEAPSHARVFIQVPGDAWQLTASIFRRHVLNDPALLKIILRHVQRDIGQSEQSVACNALHNVVQRLARWILLTQDRVGDSRIPLTQEYLAIMLGVQRTTVTSAAQSLKKAGLIRYMRGRIDVTNRAGLKRVACECYTGSDQPEVAPRERLHVVGE